MKTRREEPEQPEELAGRFVSTDGTIAEPVPKPHSWTSHGCRCSVGTSVGL